jgi:trehalose 6-phosphate synthase/phosphatase
MNLVAKEYVAASQSGRGVLILSEMAGAASELTEALQVNPNNKEQVATAIQRALTMPVDEQKIRMRSLQHRVSNYDIKKWTNDFLEQLKVVKKDQQQQLDKKLTTQHKKQLINAYKKSKASLILLDYDGTLIDFAPEPHHRLAFPTKQMKEILGKLKKSNDDEIVIVSGRSKETLQAWFGRLPVSLVAEHGGWVKQGPNWLQQKELLKNWKDNLRPILQRYVDRTVNSLLEEKDFSLVWHYRNVSHSLAGIRTASCATCSAK